MVGANLNINRNSFNKINKTKLDGKIKINRNEAFNFISIMQLIYNTFNSMENKEEKLKYFFKYLSGDVNNNNE